MNRWRTLLLAAGLLCVLAAAQAQEMTERYIPVGAYAGMTDWRTILGTLEGIDPAGRKVTLRIGSQMQTFRVTDDTRIWLDRSRLGQTTVDGALAELPPGLKAEVRVVGASAPSTARWIKVQLEP